MSKMYKTKEEVFAQAQTILRRSLRDVISDEHLREIEEKIARYDNRRKGMLGELVEQFVFGLDTNNKAEADFKIAGVELKTNPIRSHPKKRYVSKERLVFSMIDYNKIGDETWETSSFLKKNRILLIMFYLWMRDQSILDHEFKFVHLLDLLKDISSEDILQIQKDWEFIVAKIRRKEAHLLSEGDTYYLGACTKAANSRVVRDQSGAVSAKPRAFSFKQQYLNYLIQKRLLGKDVDAESIFKKKDKVRTIEEIVQEKLKPFVGKSGKEIMESLDWKPKGNPKNFKRLLANRMLGVTSNKIEELDKANVTLKVVTLEYTGTLKESISFPAFDYKDLITQVWYDEDEESMSEFHAQLETKRFLFLVFQKVKWGKDIIFKGARFWNFPMEDMPEVKRVWDKTVDCVNEGRYGDLPKIKDSKVAHVRPHGKDATDTLETPQGTREVKRGFWLNAKYIKSFLANMA